MTALSSSPVSTHKTEIHCCSPAPDALLKFQRHRAQAKHKGIGWDFTFEQWWAVWADSGKWEERGQASHQYAMGRNGDVGPYAPWNVRIITAAQNAKERNERVPNLNRSGRKPGSGKGWVYVARCKTTPYTVRFRNVVVGYFATEQEATVAYRAAVASFCSSREQTQ